MNRIESEILAWIARNADSPFTKSNWFSDNRLSVYCRLATRIFNPEDGFQKCFDVASIEVRPEFQGKGVFTELLAWIEEYAGLPTYIENVSSERFQNFFLKNGYSPCTDVPNCYYKLNELRKLGRIVRSASGGTDL